ncbi:hypothetical protein ACGFYU_33290 [Streptomyces sp. NPDC048337]|uniref:hypothetical protein n=1 Tax=Streptomyces sp. NPDC048337 TaxID=3365535 RepID=UPI0037182973
MRAALALRTSIATAALAGAMLLPAAGAAFAAPVTAVPQTAAASDNDRNESEVVAIGQGLIAVLRNQEEGPEASIHWVGYEWKPGDAYPSKASAKLTRTSPSDKIGDVYLELTKAETANPVLVVTRGGVAKSYPLPKSSKPVDKCVSNVERVDLGHGSVVDLTMSPEGPKAVAHGADPASTWSVTLTRTAPEGRDFRIVNPNGAHPVLEWWTPRANQTPIPGGRASFPALPKGCKPDYKVQDDAPAPKPTSSTPAPAKPQTAGQTSVVPKGGVAAGAEIAVEDTDNTATVAAGAGLVAAFGALGASVVLRRRRTAQR